MKAPSELKELLYTNKTTNMSHAVQWFLWIDVMEAATFSVLACRCEGGSIVPLSLVVDVKEAAVFHGP